MIHREKQSQEGLEDQFSNFPQTERNPVLAEPLYLLSVLCRPNTFYIAYTRDVQSAAQNYDRLKMLGVLIFYCSQCIEAVLGYTVCLRQRQTRRR